MLSACAFPSKMYSPNREGGFSNSSQAWCQMKFHRPEANPKPAFLSCGFKNHAGQKLYMHKCKAKMHRFRPHRKSGLGHLFVLWPIKRLIACPSSPHLHTMNTSNRLANLFNLWRNGILNGLCGGFFRFIAETACGPIEDVAKKPLHWSLKGTI